jgi:hypothetical protein
MTTRTGVRRKRPHRKTAPKVLAKSNLGKHARILEEEEVLLLLRQAVEQEGSQLAFSKRHPVNRTHLNFVLQGKRALSEKFLKLLGLRKVYTADW